MSLDLVEAGEARLQPPEPGGGGRSDRVLRRCGGLVRVAGRGGGGTVLAGFLVAGFRLLILEEERGGGHPGVAQDLIQVDPILGSDPQAGPDKVLAFLGERPPEPDVGVADLLVLLEGNVAADHVEEEDAERPDGGRVPVVPAAADPLGGSVHAGT